MGEAYESAPLAVADAGIIRTYTTIRGVDCLSARPSVHERLSCHDTQEAYIPSQRRSASEVSSCEGASIDLSTLISARRAYRLLGAAPTDRPAFAIKANPVSFQMHPSSERWKCGRILMLRVTRVFHRPPT